jgi:hypothetical protein
MTYGMRNGKWIGCFCWSMALQACFGYTDLQSDESSDVQHREDGSEGVGSVAGSENALWARPRACASSSQCKATEYCTTEDGVCNRPPGCKPGSICPAVCYGTCQPRPTGQCSSDADCRTFSDYCEGCNCRALAQTDPDPKCSGTLVQCFVDPCLDREAFCNYGRCALRPGLLQ